MNSLVAEPLECHIRNHVLNEKNPIPARHRSRKKGSTWLVLPEVTR
jgi:hypothetical protein